MDEIGQNVSDGVSTQGRKLDVSEQVTLINQPTSLIADEFTITGNYWDCKLYEVKGAHLYKDYIYHDLLGPESKGGHTTDSWIASRSLWVWDKYYSYAISCFDGGGVFPCYILNGPGAGISYVYEQQAHAGLRPIVTLNGNVMVDLSDATKDGQSRATAWVIK